MDVPPFAFFSQSRRNTGYVYIPAARNIFCFCLYHFLRLRCRSGLISPSGRTRVCLIVALLGPVFPFKIIFIQENVHAFFFLTQKFFPG